MNYFNKNLNNNLLLQYIIMHYNILSKYIKILSLFILFNYISFAILSIFISNFIN